MPNEPHVENDVADMPPLPDSHLSFTHLENTRRVLRENIAAAPLCAPPPAPASRPSYYANAVVDEVYRWHDNVRFVESTKRKRPRKKFTAKQIAEIANLIRVSLVPNHINENVFRTQYACYRAVVNQFTDYFCCHDYTFNVSQFTALCGHKLMDKFAHRGRNHSALTREQPLP
jgi:hypothetical protein